MSANHKGTESCVPNCTTQTERIGLALSGGGSRAIAFHLGCLRALHDRGVLDKVEVISTVSGGSVIGAMYAYGGADFAAFDRRVVDLLRRGLVGSILKSLIFSPIGVFSIGTFVANQCLFAACRLVQLVAVAVLGVACVRKSTKNGILKKIQVQTRRWCSRTTAFAHALDREVFKGAKMTDVTRSTQHGSLQVVVNATELRTGTAFRFSNTVSGATRFGTVTASDVLVANAVAASAAYPALLPPLDVKYQFRGSDGLITKRRAILTDGGVYDNLGTACMEPGRRDDVSVHCYAPEYLIVCDAGIGVAEGDAYPVYWANRMTAAFETVFRRVQNDTRGRLHAYAQAGSIKGFILAYLGQVDARVANAPADLVPRASVVDYPTDFLPMREGDIALLTTRGEQLMRAQIERYAADI